ncbi:MAG: type VI secretion system-associated protein TagO [Gammaproteobacteria bacterium]
MNLYRFACCCNGIDCAAARSCLVDFTRDAALLITVLPVVVACVTPDISRPARAPDQGLLTECASIPGSVERLACFDNVAANIAGSWRIASQTSPTDGSRSIYLHLDASGLTFDRARQPIRPTLWIRCQDNRTSLYVAWDAYLGTYYADVRYRVDSAPVGTESWLLADDKEAAGLWNDAAAIPFIKALFGGEELVMNVTPYNDRVLTGQFELAGIEQAIAPVREVCGW